MIPKKSKYKASRVEKCWLIINDVILFVSLQLEECTVILAIQLRKLLLRWYPTWLPTRPTGCPSPATRAAATAAANQQPVPQTATLSAAQVPMMRSLLRRHRTPSAVHNRLIHLPRVSTDFIVIHFLENPPQIPKYPITEKCFNCITRILWEPCYIYISVPKFGFLGLRNQGNYFRCPPGTENIQFTCPDQH